MPPLSLQLSHIYEVREYILTSRDKGMLLSSPILQQSQIHLLLERMLSTHILEMSIDINKLAYIWFV